MKQLFILLIALVFGGQNSFASTQSSIRGYGNSFIFVENGINFSVYPDGEFDFYIDTPRITAGVHTGNVSITFNSGYAYDPYVQYDAYGAVIQIENTPIYYDFYGRVTRIGNINILYNGNYLRRIGGMHIYFNAHGIFSHYTGFINGYNRVYVHRPFHRYFRRPSPAFCMVNYRPYRKYYVPERYTYYKPYRNNHRRSYVSVGKTYHHKGNNSRRSIYENDKRVSRRNDAAITRSIRARSENSVSPRNTSRVSRGANHGNINRSSARASRDNTSNSVRSSRAVKYQPSKSVNRAIRSSNASNRNAVQTKSVPRQKVQTTTVSKRSPVQVNSRSTSRAARPKATIERSSRNASSKTYRSSNSSSNRSAPTARSSRSNSRGVR